MRPSAVLLQLVLVTLLVAGYIWLGRHAFAGSQVVFAALLVSLLLWSHRQRGDSMRGIGFRVDTAPRTALFLAPVAIVSIAITLAAGYSKHSLNFPSLPATLEKLMSSKSVEQAVEIQTSYAKRAYDDYMQQMSKIGGMYASMAKEAYKPVEKMLQNGG